MTTNKTRPTSLDDKRQREQMVKERSRTALHRIQTRKEFHDAYLANSPIDDYEPQRLTSPVATVQNGIDYTPQDKTIAVEPVPELNGTDEEIRLKRDARIRGHLEKTKERSKRLHEPPLSYYNEAKPGLRKKLTYTP